MTGDLEQQTAEAIAHAIDVFDIVIYMPQVPWVTRLEAKHARTCDRRSARVSSGCGSAVAGNRLRI